MKAALYIVTKLWNLCHVLRGDGVTYHQYVTELTYLLFLKMADETGEEVRLPEGLRWRDLNAREGSDQLDFYRRLLLDLGSKGSGRVRDIFADAQTTLRKPTTLKLLTDTIDKLDWFSGHRDEFGDLYEGLLAKNAEEKKSGAGQYFTPRPLIDCVVRLMKPRPGEVIQDPAAGTGGFLIAAFRHVYQATGELFELPQAQQWFQRHQSITGMELVQDTHRLCLMNLMLHGIDGDVILGDTLSSEGKKLGKADLILTNPPFGTKRGGGGPTRDDFTVTAVSSNKQLAFVEHCYRTLKPGGRCAIVVPDNVLFEDNTGKRLRQQWMELCDLHTILRLPTGIFYSQGVKTNVAFFRRGETDRGNTKAIWFYDMRANMPSFGKTRPLSKEDFADFEDSYGNDSNGGAGRFDQGEDGRFRLFSRAKIAERGDNLDINWLKDGSVASDVREPPEIAAEIVGKLREALSEIDQLQEILVGGAQRNTTDLK